MTCCDGLETSISPGTHGANRYGHSGTDMSMTNHPRSSTLHPLNRRQLVLGVLAVAAGAAVPGLPRRGGSVLASGQLPGANLIELDTYTGWRRTWDLIVPLSIDRAFPRRFLLYDRAAGEAKVIAVGAFGGFQEIRTILNWRTTWDVLAPSGFPGIAGVMGLFAYDRGAGQVTTFQIDATGSIQELRTYTNWRKTWTTFCPFGNDGLLAYERSAGYVTLFTIDQTGSVHELRSYNDWSQTWDLLTNGPFTTATLPGRDVLLYDRTARRATGLTIGANGETASFAQYSGWRQTWTSIQGGLFLFRGFSGSMTADLLLFDQNAQEIEFLDIGPGSTLVSVLLTATPDVNSWTHVAAIGPELLLLYDRATGTAAFYATDRAPLPVPTVTPTPIVIGPTPTPIPTGRVNVRLEQGRGNAWHTYTGKSDDPTPRGNRRAYIIGVKNTSGKRIALIHRDRAEKRTGPVFVKATEVSDAFNGMEVAGDWEARITGGQSEAPPRVTLEVRYEIR
jgi:hypothetical protein